MAVRPQLADKHRPMAAMECNALRPQLAESGWTSTTAIDPERSSSVTNTGRSAN
jgi:hypothetical protein